MISNKNVDCDGLITFWKKPRYRSLIPSLQPVITWLLKLFGNKMIVSKQSKKLFQSRGASTTFYFKVRQALFQSGADAVISNWVSLYFKVGELFQSGTKVISKWGSYFKVRQNVISKWGSYFKARQLFKMGHNTCSICVNVQVRSNQFSRERNL